MYTYYVENDNKIVLYSPSKMAVENMLKNMPQYKDNKIKRTNKEIVEYRGSFYFTDDEEYITKKAEAEENRINELYMTRSDFFDGTIKAWGVNGDDLLPVIETLINSLNITDVEKKIAINNYKNALNFYRKHALFTLLSNIPIPIASPPVVITATQWDKFFDETAKRNPDAYKELLPEE